MMARIRYFQFMQYPYQKLQDLYQAICSIKHPGLKFSQKSPSKDRTSTILKNVDRTDLFLYLLALSLLNVLVWIFKF